MDSFGKPFLFNHFDMRCFYSSIVSDAPWCDWANEWTAPALRTGRGRMTQGSRMSKSAQKYIPDPAEMRRVFEKLEENDDGVVSTDELSRFMQRLGFEMTKEDALPLVKTVDHNCDGFVDFEEFYSLYSLYTGLETSDSSGQIDDQEEQDDNLQEAFLIFDEDKKGFITVQDLQSVLLSLGMAEGNSLKKCYQMIEGVDADRNDQVDFQEFKKMMTS